LRQGPFRPHRVREPAAGVHAPGDLQPRGARPARLPRRGAARGPSQSRPAGRRGAAHMTLAIDVHGLNKSFGGKHVVDDVTIQVEEGRICGFLGPNGSGKTTTLRMLCGLLTPDSGSGQALGYDIIRQADEVKRRTGYMTQRFSLYEDLTIAENLQFTARVYGLDR